MSYPANRGHILRLEGRSASIICGILGNFCRFQGKIIERRRAQQVDPGKVVFLSEFGNENYHTNALYY
jgi:hypothetical protein